MSHQLKVAVIDGWHPYEIQHFHSLLRSYSDVDYYMQFWENWACNGPDQYSQYDALLFYNMNIEMPAEDGFKEAVEKSVQHLGDTEQGIVLLHHSILSIPENSKWSELVGIDDREFGYHPNQRFTVKVANSDHPITQGLNDWEMEDETYTMKDTAEADGSNILLTTEHDPSMSVLAWTREVGKARIFCFQSGHDHLTWDNENFRRVLHRGIQWASRKI